jgi:uncharacterized protein (TIGR03083 family)
MSSDEIFAMIAEERRALAGLLDGLSDAQWETPSLCEGWRVREVVAHLAMPFSASLLRIGFRVILKRGDFNKVADEWARQEKRSNKDLVAALRANAEHRFTPPGGGPEMPLTDVMAHTQDIVRPLGITHPARAEPAAVALEALASPKGQAFFGGSIGEGLSFVSTDTGWRNGTGEEVRGTAAALICSLGRRTAALGELSGEGAPLLRERICG